MNSKTKSSVHASEQIKLLNEQFKEAFDHRLRTDAEYRKDWEKIFEISKEGSRETSVSPDETPKELSNEKND